MSPPFTLIELLVVVSIIAVLASIALPVFISVQERGAQTKDLANAKQIGLACKLYAADNDGKYPNKDGTVDPPVALIAASTSNQAFALLVPQYLPTEELFYVGKSAWSPNVPDEKQRSRRIAAGQEPTTSLRGRNDGNFPPKLPSDSRRS